MRDFAFKAFSLFLALTISGVTMNTAIA